MNSSSTSRAGREDNIDDDDLFLVPCFERLLLLRGHNLNGDGDGDAAARLALTDTLVLLTS